MKQISGVALNLVAVAARVHPALLIADAPLPLLPLTIVITSIVTWTLPAIPRRGWPVPYRRRGFA